MVRVRFAPSPTGTLHVGGARTALFNWLFARKNGGQFVLRIEDTDTTRSQKSYTDNIIESLNWLGLTADEGPYFQSERMDIYRKYAEKLLSKDKAYPCFCPPHSHDTKICKCAELDKAKVQKLLSSGSTYAIKLCVDEKEITFYDTLRGDIRFDLKDLSDLVIVKSDGTPAYNFAVVVDDVEMGITHVIRGDDHISNTPKQILIYQALDFTLPIFAHIPMILGKDGGRLSKREGAVSVIEYRNQGFLTEAMVNFLALLGWCTADSRQIFSLEELMALFDIKRVKKSAAVFDLEKLVWLNKEHLKLLNADTLVQRVEEYLRLKHYLTDDVDRGYLKRVIETIGGRLKTLEDIWKYGDFFLHEDILYSKEHFPSDDGMIHFFDAFIKNLTCLDTFNAASIENVTNSTCSSFDIPLKVVAKHVRYALTGKNISPGIFETMETLGKKRVLHRLQQYSATKKSML